MTIAVVVSVDDSSLTRAAQTSCWGSLLSAAATSTPVSMISNGWNSIGGQSVAAEAVGEKLIDLGGNAVA